MPEQSRWKTYKDFVLDFDRADAGWYRVEATSPAGDAENQFRLPFDERDLKLFVLGVGSPRRSGLRGDVPEPMQPAVDFGQKLYDAVFAGDVRDVFVSSRHDADQNGYGLRIQLRLNDTPELANLPWEFLYDGRDFLGLSDITPIVRYAELPSPARPMLVEMPLRILVTISAPTDLPPLDVMAEQDKVKAALQNLIERRQVELTFTEDATLSGLQHTLRHARSRNRPYHIWHYIGHGVFDPAAQASFLMMTNESGQSYAARGFQLGTMFNSYPEVRLALLNACEGARVGQADPFAGVAAALVERGIGAVIGMQFEITDRAASLFAGEFYAALVDGLPVDSALTEARRAVFFQPNWVEWATPVLFMRVTDGRLFDVRPPTASRLAIPVIPSPNPTPPRSGPGVRPPGTTFLGRAFDAVSNLAGLKKPAESASGPQGSAPPAPAREDWKLDKAAVQSVLAATVQITYRPMPYLPGPGDVHYLKTPWRIRLDVYTPTHYEAIGIDLYSEIVLGRNQAYIGQPLLDMDRYGAKDLGVSRQHVALRPSPEGLFVIDQGSTNGTQINGTQAKLGIATPLKNGDILKLSRLALVVQIISRP